MSLLDQIADDPTIIFNIQKDIKPSTDEEQPVNSILKEVKSILDPITASNSVLDEIHIDGLVPSQVWGQVKLVVDGCVENVMFESIPRLKEQYGDLIGSPTLSEDENDDDEEEEEEYDDDDDDDEAKEGEEEQQNEQEEHDSEAEYYNAVEDLEEDEENATGEPLTPATTNTEDPDVDFVPGKDKFGLNDKFFSIDDYNKQVQALEDGGDGLDGDDEEEIDLFADLSDEDDDDEEEEMYTYDDFFKKQVDPSTYKNAGISGPVPNDQRKKGKKVKFAKGEDLKEEDYDEAFNSAMADFMDDGEEDEEEADDKKKSKESENLSTFEKQQRQIQMEIEQLEAESIAEKKWTMKGEASVKNRDADALLEEDLEFDRTAKPVPVITQEVTESIEEIIKRRIKDQQFDELKKRIVSELNDFKPSSRVEVSETKSAKSLAEIYEDEYLDRESDTVNEELKKAHDEISELFSGLMNKLDSLTSAHFVPKPKQQLVDIKVQTSTIQLEDQTPLTMASNDTLAPQEVYRTNRKIGKNEVVLKSGVVMNKEELNRDDKQRLRRARKRKIHNKMKENAEKKQKVVVKQYSTA
ncbi:unnamed protein product [Ambrosiozyma monospora]|uniref:U3 small nucleolar ribonucleoprotein protein MPP10 n=1 Tax=Ambrosiozyma monospora TaxID=43982 RepID=A0A9W7DFK1_AMBMO|nr:unnamed protein product [Ambrosiozyma monospora]